MNVFGRIVLVIALAVLTTPAEAVNPNSFEFQLPISVGTTDRGSVAVRLPIEALAVVRTAADMRIFDSTGKEIPFFLFRFDGGTTSVEQAVSVFNLGILDGNQQRFEFTLPSSIQEIRSLTLVIGDLSYNHEIDLYGRDTPEEEFRLIKKEMRIVRLLSEDEALRYEYNRIQFPPQQLRYYKAVVHLDAQHQPLSIKEVRVEQASEIPVVRETIPLAVNALDTTSEPLKSIPAFKVRGELKRSTLYQLTPAHPLPLDLLTLTFDRTEFARRVTLYGFDPKERRTGAVLSSGSIFSLSGEENNSLTFLPSRSKAYVLEIFQGDDVPVNVSAANGLLYAVEARFIIDSLGGVPPYALYFGTSSPIEPQYDIVTRIGRMSKPVFLPLDTGAISTNPNYVPEERQVPQTERTPLLLYGAVGLLVAILATRLMSLAKELPKDQ